MGRTAECLPTLLPGICLHCWEFGYKRHMEKYGTTYWNWDTTRRSDAQQLLAGITNFEFIVVFLTVYQYLLHLAGITAKLQKRTLDIIEAHEEIKDIAKTYRLARENVTSGFAKIFEHSRRIAEKIDFPIQMPHIVSRQRHRSNATADNPSDYFQRNVAIPLLDHIISFLEQQFCDSSDTAVMLLVLVPSVLCTNNLEAGTMQIFHPQNCSKWNLSIGKITIHARKPEKDHHQLEKHWQRNVSQHICPFAHCLYHSSNILLMWEKYKWIKAFKQFS